MWNGDIDNIKEVVTYLNSELDKGRSQKDIEVNDFKVNERVIAKRLTRVHYKKIENKWVEYDSPHTNAISENKPIEKEKTNNEILIFDDKILKNNLMELAKNYERIMAFLNEYEGLYEGLSDGVKIVLPIETKADYRTTIRINNVIWEQFNEFADKHKQFTKKDLISMALKDYMQKYKKE